MTLQEAILDKNRPLSVTPREWMCAVEAVLVEEKELIDESAIRIAKEKKIEDSHVDGALKIDLGIDQIVQGIKIVCSGLSLLDAADLQPDERRVYQKARVLITTAIVPYVYELIEQLENGDEKSKE